MYFAENLGEPLRNDFLVLEVFACTELAIVVYEFVMAFKAPRDTPRSLDVTDILETYFVFVRGVWAGESVSLYADNFRDDGVLFELPEKLFDPATAAPAERDELEEEENEDDSDLDPGGEERAEEECWLDALLRNHVASLDDERRRVGPVGSS